jgi:hypothetical protein
MSNKWNSIKEILPEVGKEVIFFGEHTHIYSGNFMFIGYIADKYIHLSLLSGREAEQDFYDDEITHWRELPDKPKIY